MRDAVTFESLGIPAVILVNDVFGAIADATAELLRLPGDYVASNVVWLPHPTSTLTDDAAAALIDDRIGDVRAALLGARRSPTRRESAPAPAFAQPAARTAAPADADAGLARARDLARGLAESLRTDGAELVLVSLRDGTLSGELRIVDPTCDDGSCIMPAPALERMIEALVRPHVPHLRKVELRECT